VFDHGLSGQMWPIHCKPYDDEVLSSWLSRLSRAYGAEPARFCSSLGLKRAVWRTDLDKGIDEELLFMLATKTATPRTHVMATTVRGYRSYPKKELAARQRPPWLLSVHRRSHARYRPWFQYCPHCLHEDADPYCRRSWLLAFVTVCPDHHRRLLDRCGACGAVVTLHWFPGDAEIIMLCHGCQYDIRSTQAPLLQGSLHDQRLVRFQAFLLHTMQSGRCRLGGYSSIGGTLFFRVLDRLAQFYLTTMHASLFQEAFDQYEPIAFATPPSAAQRQQSIEVADVEERLELMRFVSWWIERRPGRFMAFCEESEL
jgi:hypothetical protein